MWPKPGSLMTLGEEAECEQRDNHVKRHKKTAVSKTRREASGNPPCQHLDLQLPGSKLWENTSLLFKPSSLRSSAMAAWANEDRSYGFYPYSTSNQPETEKVEATCPGSPESRIQTQVYTVPKARFFTLPSGCLKGTLKHLAECSFLFGSMGHVHVRWWREQTMRWRGRRGTSKQKWELRGGFPHWK